jgi:CheY-like chemotaxis protein
MAFEILIVDDEPDIRLLIEGLLRGIRTRRSPPSAPGGPR